MTAGEFLNLEPWERAEIARENGLDVPEELSAMDDAHWQRVAKAVEKLTELDQEEYNDDDDGQDDDEDDASAFWFTEGEFD